MNTKRMIAILGKVILILASAFSFLFLYGCSKKTDSLKVDAGAKQAVPQSSVRQERPKNRVVGPVRTASDAAAIKVAFKVDPRITQGQYMGDRWVSPSTYTRVAEGKICNIETRAVVFDSRGRQLALSPQWVPGDPKIVTVSPGQGKAVTITVHRAGQSSLKAVAEGISKELAIKATDYGNSIEVEISQ